MSWSVQIVHCDYLPRLVYFRISMRSFLLCFTVQFSALQFIKEIIVHSLGVVLFTGSKIKGRLATLLWKCPTFVKDKSILCVVW